MHADTSFITKSHFRLAWDLMVPPKEAPAHADTVVAPEGTTPVTNHQLNPQHPLRVRTRATSHANRRPALGTRSGQWLASVRVQLVPYCRRCRLRQICHGPPPSRRAMSQSKVAVN